MGDDRNALLMGLQTFEVIHEGVIEPLTVCYDFLYDYLVKSGKNVDMVQDVFRKWADQEIKYGVPDNNWNMMQARFITYLAIALEDDSFYQDGKGQQYYIDQVLNQNSAKQKALKDVIKNFDPVTAIWPEVAHYSIMVSDDLLEIYCLMDKTLNNHLLADDPILEKAILANFNYLFPNGFTVAYGDAKHARLRFNSLELLIAQYRKYHQPEKESRITKQLNRFVEDGAYVRDEIKSLFDLFFYVEDLLEVPAAESLAEMITPTFYSPNVSWIVQRNANSLEDGMMASINASLGNHSHTNGINIELFAKGMVIAPDGAAGVSYWSEDHRDYYSRFPAHNTVVVDGISDYRNMRGTQAFDVNSIYPPTDIVNPWQGYFTYSDVSFFEPSTGAKQTRVTGTVRTSESSGYFVDIFRSSRSDRLDKKHEYIFHSQGAPVVLKDDRDQIIATSTTDELSSEKGDQVGYDYFSDKMRASYSGDFLAQFSMPSILNKELRVNLWMKGDEGRTVFTTMAPYSRAIHPESVPEAIYHQPLPTLIVRQDGEALSRPFVTIIDAFNQEEEMGVDKVDYFSPVNESPDFVGITVQSGANHTDYVYNDIKGKVRYTFDDGAFEGTYAIASYENELLKAFFLGHGSYLEKGQWKIETGKPDGTVCITTTQQGINIDAKQPFKLTMPLPDRGKNSLQLVGIGKSSGQKFMGKLRIKGDQKFMEIELPALNNEEFRIIYE
ncbi:MAG: heparinase II/III family protein [Saprospiraceae bacterium]|nr:heparinase II/III family protein [Saprospiraceae bacterium]